MDFFDPYNYFFELPLYTAIEITKETETELFHLIYYKHRIDAYNASIKENSTFSISNTFSSENYYLNGIEENITHKITCVRTGEVYIIFSKFIRTEVDMDDFGDPIYSYKILKVGQYPSIADLHISKIKDYDKVLSKENLKEFTRAIGLAANGVGIGSFVYLRRIFESLIEEAHNKAKLATEWNEEEFQKSRMAEKIALLAHELPEFLVENKTIYGILSKGVHELKENECLQYFEPLKAGIELILDEKAEKLEKQEKLKKAKQTISAISSKLANENK